MIDIEYLDESITIIDGMKFLEKVVRFIYERKLSDNPKKYS